MNRKTKLCLLLLSTGFLLLGSRWAAGVDDGPGQRFSTKHFIVYVERLDPEETSEPRLLRRRNSGVFLATQLGRKGVAFGTNADHRANRLRGMGAATIEEHRAVRPGEHRRG